MNSGSNVGNNQPSAPASYGDFLICGRVKTPLVFNIGKLRAMDLVQTKELPLICGSGEPKGSLGPCTGVLLTDVINKAEVLITDHNDTKKMFLIASSDDGYKAVFSWQELFNTETGDGVTILMDKDGELLHDGLGAVDMISAKDHLSGPRYIKRLKTIEIVMVE